jgi:hypothetical protein
MITGALNADGPVPGKMIWLFDGANTKLAAALTSIDGRYRMCLEAQYDQLLYARFEGDDIYDSAASAEVGITVANGRLEGR